MPSESAIPTCLQMLLFILFVLLIVLQRSAYIFLISRLIPNTMLCNWPSMQYQRCICLHYFNNCLVTSMLLNEYMQFTLHMTMLYILSWHSYWCGLFSSYRTLLVITLHIYVYTWCYTPMQVYRSNTNSYHYNCLKTYSINLMTSPSWKATTATMQSLSSVIADWSTTSRPSPE